MSANLRRINLPLTAEQRDTLTLLAAFRLTSRDDANLPASRQLSPAAACRRAVTLTAAELAEETGDPALAALVVTDLIPQVAPRAASRHIDRMLHRLEDRATNWLVVDQVERLLASLDEAISMQPRFGHQQTMHGDWRFYRVDTLVQYAILASRVLAAVSA